MGSNFRFSVNLVMVLGAWGCITVLSANLTLGVIAFTVQSEPEDASPSADTSEKSDRFIHRTRQLTYEGRRAGEGYFSRDGNWMVFQSEREEGNPFFQIYLMNLQTGDVQQISTGAGRTTCAWIHPNLEQVMFSSTHKDPEAAAHQKAEFEARQRGERKHHAWTYDPWYDIFVRNLKTNELTQVTDVRGYDAEGSYSPDGRHILFASNRHAYSTPLSDQQQEAFDKDASVMMDLYIMDADGRNVRRLTDSPGYDGGPFFSADGKKICWRKFSLDGLRAEIHTMNLDGSEQKQVTFLGAMSWAPFFHPSGEYLIFTTNRHGFDNFELYLVDALGTREPVRVTHTPGFDGLPTFSPDGRRISWTSDRNSPRQGQIFLADWDHLAATKAIAESPLLDQQ